MLIRRFECDDVHHLLISLRNQNLYLMELSRNEKFLSIEKKPSAINMTLFKLS